jgi:endonuclease-3 related protein
MRKKINLIKIYEALFSKYGPQHWWPGDSPWEVCAGAVLTQNTNWTNVEKAIANLKRMNLLEPEKILSSKKEKLEEALKPSGYFRIKAERLRNMTKWWIENVRDNRPTRIAEGENFVRNSLLSVNGVGHETADSILLYSFEIPVFVIDAYTKRIMHRHFGIEPRISYHDLQTLFHQGLPKDAKLFNEFHALFVRIAKDHCRKNICTDECPLKVNIH